MVSSQGAAFGVSSIAAQSKEQFASYLPSLVPRLYRYKYDPIPRIQLAMSNIWNAVVPHSSKTVSRSGSYDMSNEEWLIVISQWWLTDQIYLLIIA